MPKGNDSQPALGPRPEIRVFIAIVSCCGVVVCAALFWYSSAFAISTIEVQLVSLVALPPWPGTGDFSLIQQWLAATLTGLGDDMLPALLILLALLPPAAGIFIGIDMARVARKALRMNSPFRRADGAASDLVGVGVVAALLWVFTINPIWPEIAAVAIGLSLLQGWSSFLSPLP